jgi:hypothetical protein
LPKDGIGIDMMSDADFGDAFGCLLNSDVMLSPDEVALGLLKSRPWWFRALLRIRGILVKPFGLRGDNTKLKEDESKSAGEPPAVPVNPPNREMKETAGDRSEESAWKESNCSESYPISSKMAFFKVEKRTATDLLLSNEDKHLKALLWITIQDQEVKVITLVKFKNRFGRVYMFVIGPFHKLIVSRLLKSSLVTTTDGKARGL